MCKKQMNNEIKLGSIPTKGGYMDKQGYGVYSIYGTAITITNDGGVLGIIRAVCF